MSSYIGNLVLVTLHASTSQYDEITLAEATSFFSFLNWALVLYWMRLFDQTAFYVLMIKETVKDIPPFMILFLICIGMFANSLVILDEKQWTMEKDYGNGD